MLLSKHCPHTGVVNFYDSSEPYLAIGSVTKCGTAADGSKGPGSCYTWRFYGSEIARAGRTADASSAERNLRSLVAKAVVSEMASYR